MYQQTCRNCALTCEMTKKEVLIVMSLRLNLWEACITPVILTWLSVTHSNSPSPKPESLLAAVKLLQSVLQGQCCGVNHTAWSASSQQFRRVPDSLLQVTTVRATVFSGAGELNSGPLSVNAYSWGFWGGMDCKSCVVLKERGLEMLTVRYIA